MKAEAVPAAVPEAERLIEEAELNSLYYDLLLGLAVDPNPNRTASEHPNPH